MADVEIDVTFPDPVITDVVVDRIGPSGGSLWGTIGGSLASQSDLESSLNGKFPNSMSTGKLLGRTSASTGTVEEISIGSGLTLSNGLLISPGSNLNFTPSRVYNVADYGAVGDGTTDDTAFIQAAIDAAPDGSIVWFDPTKNYKITSTLVMQGRTSITLMSGSTADGGVPRITWAGAAHGTVLQMYKCYWCKIRGIAFYCANGTSVDYYIDTDKVGGTGNNNSHNFFEYLFLHGATGGNVGNSSFIGIAIGRTNTSNNENMQFDNVAVTGSTALESLVIANDGVMNSASPVLTSASNPFTIGQVGQVIRVGLAGAAGATLKSTVLSFQNSGQVTLSDNAAGSVTGARVHIGESLGIGIYNGPNPNAKHQMFRHVSFSHCNIGIKSDGGSINVFNFGGTANNIGVQINGQIEPVVIDQMVTEGNLIEVQKTLDAGILTLKNCRGSNGSQLTEKFYDLIGTVVWESSGIESLPPAGGQIVSGSNTRLFLLNTELAKGIPQGMSLAELGISSLSEVQSQGDTHVSGWPVNRVVVPFVGQGADITCATSNNKKHAFSFIRTLPMNPASFPAQEAASQDTRIIGDDEIEIFGVGRPNAPFVRGVGTHADSNPYYFTVVAVDSTGNKTLRSYTTSIGVVNNTLSANNYLHVEWSPVPNAASYELYHGNPNAPESQAELIANGITNTYYNLTSNPAGSYSTYSSLLPSFNQSTGIKYRARQINVTEPAFTANDTTPSVAIASDFVTANSNPTSITTFDDGIDGQIIRVRVNDTNTTFVNGTPLVTNSGGNITATNGLIYSFILRASKWRQI